MGLHCRRIFRGGLKLICFAPREQPLPGAAELVEVDRRFVALDVRGLKRGLEALDDLHKANRELSREPFVVSGIRSREPAGLDVAVHAIAQRLVEQAMVDRSLICQLSRDEHALNELVLNLPALKVGGEGEGIVIELIDDRHCGVRFHASQVSLLRPAGP